MKTLVLSDIHTNFAALEAVVQAETDFDRLVVPGDLVGYGPDPRGCIEFIRRRAFVAVRGNHDHALAFGTSKRGFLSTPRSRVEPPLPSGPLIFVGK